LLTGSTIITQLKKEEAEASKGFYQAEIGKETKINFVPLENDRKFFYKDLELKSDLSIRDQVESILNETLKEEFKKKPIIKIKILGKETGIIEKELREIEKKFSDKAIIYFQKELESEEMTKKIELLRNLRERKLSIEETGLQILKKNLEELKFKSSFDAENIFRLLSEGDVEKTFDIITGQQKTLNQIFGE
jgi:hypothetical protein